MNVFDELIPKAAPPSQAPLILYGEVESIDPLVITVDGDEEPLEITPSSTVNGILPGDKVAMTLQNDELIVTGIIDGDVDYIAEFIDGIAVAQDAAEQALLGVSAAARVPAQVLAVAVSDSLYVDPTGRQRARLAAGWGAVTTTSTGDPCTISGYEVWGEKSGGDWKWITTVGANAVTWDDLDPGSAWAFKVRAIGEGMVNPGAFSPAAAITFAHDTTPPNQPSTPTTTPYLGSVVVSWDGKDSGGAAMPDDFDRCDLHLSATSGFTPNASTRIHSFSLSGTCTISDLVYGTTYYAKLVAYDTSGNASTPSAQSSGLVRPAGTADLAAAAIEEIADYTIDEVRPSIDAKNSITTSSSNPPAEWGGSAGDRWEKYAAGKMVASWSWDGSTWQSTPLDPTYIPQIDIGSGTFGSLAGSRLDAASVNAEKVTISSGNLVPSVNFSVGWTAAAGATIASTGGYVGDSACTVPASASLRSSWLATGQVGGDRPYLIKATEGGVYRFSARAKSEGTAFVASGVRIYVQWYTGDHTPIGGASASAYVPAGTAANTWVEVVHVATAPAGAARVQLTLQVQAAQSNAVTWSTPIALRMASGELIVDGAVRASHLEAELVLTNQVIAGSPDASHTRMSSAGFSGHAPDPADGVVKDFMRLDESGLSFGFDPSNPAARIGGKGAGSFKSLSAGSLAVGGDPLATILSRLPQGLVAYAEKTSSVTGVTGTETAIAEIRAILQPGRIYSLRTEGLAVRSSAANDVDEWKIRIAYDGTAVTTSSTALRSGVRRPLSPVNIYTNSPPVTGWLSTNGISNPREARILLTLVRFSGTGTLDVWGSVGWPITFSLRDEGPYIAPTEAKATFVSEWTPSNAWSHGTEGAAHPPVDNLWRAKRTGSTRVIYPQFTFGGDASSGETTKTIATALSGATLIKAEVGIAVNYGSRRTPTPPTISWDPTVVIYPTTNTSSNSTLPGPSVTISNIAAPSYRWMDVTSIFTTSMRGFYLDLPSVAAGQTVESRGGYADTRLRLTYSR